MQNIMLVLLELKKENKLGRVGTYFLTYLRILSQKVY